MKFTMDIKEVWDSEALSYRLKKKFDVDQKVKNRLLLIAKELATNIIKYGEEGTITIESDDNRFLITATDRGPGIEDIEHAWEDGFGKGRKIVNEEKVYPHKGLGSGLSAVNRLSDDVKVKTGEDGTTITSVINI